MILNPKVIFRVVFLFLISFLRSYFFCCLLGPSRWWFKYIREEVLVQLIPLYATHWWKLWRRGQLVLNLLFSDARIWIVSKLYRNLVFEIFPLVCFLNSFLLDVKLCFLLHNFSCFSLIGASILQADFSKGICGVYPVILFYTRNHWLILLLEGSIYCISVTLCAIDMCLFRPRNDLCYPL